MSFYSGKTGYIKIGVSGTPNSGQLVALKKWSFNTSHKLVSVNNFQSKGCNQWVSGFVGAEITISGAFPVGVPEGGRTLLPFDLVSLQLGIIDAPFQIFWNISSAWVEKITVDNDAEDTPQFTATLQTNCCFDLSFLLSKNGC